MNSSHHKKDYSQKKEHNFRRRYRTSADDILIAPRTTATHIQMHPAVRTVPKAKKCAHRVFSTEKAFFSAFLEYGVFFLLANASSPCTHTIQQTHADCMDKMLKNAIIRISLSFVFFFLQLL